jgi:CysZ protein
MSSISLKYKLKVNNILISLGAWIKGLRYILSNSWVWKYIFMAIISNLIIYFVLVFGSFKTANFVVNFILTYFENFSDNILIFNFLNFLIWACFLVLITQIFGGISSIINAPIYSILTTKIMQKETLEISNSDNNFLKEIWLTFIFELKKLIFCLLILILLFATNTIPVLGSLIYLLLITLQLIFSSGLDVFEPYHLLQKYNFRQRLKAINSSPALYWPFLLICGVLGSIPFLNIVLTPISIVGACKLIKQEQNLK